MLLEHQLVIHLVDMIPRQNQHELRRIAFDDVDVLEDGVGGAFVPLQLGDALRGGEDVEAFVALGAQEVPAALKVPDERVRLVLRGDADAADARVDRVRQREVDDPALAAEINRRLGTGVGQLVQPAAASAREHIGHGVTRQRSSPVVHHRLSCRGSVSAPVPGRAATIDRGRRRCKRQVEWLVRRRLPG